MREKSAWRVYLFPSFLAGGAGIFACIAASWALWPPPLKSDAHKKDPSAISKVTVSAALGPHIRQGQLPAAIDMDRAGALEKLNVQYTIDSDTQEMAESLLEKYRADFGAFVAVDATTGQVLAMASRVRGKPTEDNLALRASFPAASVFKVVTAGAALDSGEVDPDTVIRFTGANHTLYKSNVFQSGSSRWSREMTIREAFGRSVNTVFSKLGLFYAGPERLSAYAERFLFNVPISADFPVDMGHALFEEKDSWQVASAAAGFTRMNTMSPLQGALIAAAVAHDGVLMEPFLVQSLAQSDGKEVYRAEPRRSSVVVGPESARQLRELFRETVQNGTSRRFFRNMLRSQVFRDIEFGGKTGSLSGESPRGRNDWFVGYARTEGRRIAVAALMVNQEKWQVRSSDFASQMLRTMLRPRMVAQMSRKSSVQ